MRAEKIIGLFAAISIVSIVGFVWGHTENRSLPVSQITPSPTRSVSTHPSRTPIKISSGNMPSIPLQLPSGFVIHEFAANLGNPRDLQFSPGGTLLVSNANSGEVIALPDKNGDGAADTNTIVIAGENHPHGLAFYKGKLYIAEVNRVIRYTWNENTLTATKEKVLFSLPENNDHNNRTILFNISGTMYISVGSTCNVCYENSPLSGTIIVSDADGNNPRVLARGLRNAPFMQFNPKTGELWVTEMGRDYLGDTVPPDEINIVKEGKDYGWPNCYGDKIPDTNFNVHAQCQNTESPIYNIPAHNAPLGLTFITSSQFPSDWQGDLLVAYHGSWNKSVATGFKVVHMKLQGNTITNVDDFLTGFLQGTTNSSALGRPVDLTFDTSGNLYLSDDRTGKIYIIQKQH